MEKNNVSRRSVIGKLLAFSGILVLPLAVFGKTRDDEKKEILPLKRNRRSANQANNPERREDVIQHLGQEKAVPNGSQQTPVVQPQPPTSLEQDGIDHLGPNKESSAQAQQQTGQVQVTHLGPNKENSKVKTTFLKNKKR